MSISGSSGIIKTTARYREPNEAQRQWPVIQVADPAGNRQHLPNTIRASLDSGRDNPFRPDGPIYKSADPIVDYYKNGANLSRPQSPTDSQILLGLLQPASAKKLENDQIQSHNNNKTDVKQPHDGRTNSASCWRKCFCCCIKRRSKTLTIEISTTTDYSEDNTTKTTNKRADDSLTPISRLQTSGEQQQLNTKLSGSSWSKLEQISASQPGFETRIKDINEDEQAETCKSNGRRCVIS